MAQYVLSRFVAALGGTLKLIADFGDEQLYATAKAYVGRDRLGLRFRLGSGERWPQSPWGHSALTCSLLLKVLL
jgi:hypothetical protein